MATDSLNAPRSAHSPLRNSLMVCALMLLAMPGLASADRARVQSLGGVDLLMEDESNLFINPAHISSYSNRAWFSLGVTGSGGAVGFDPMGGGSIQIKELFNLGLVLNRSPRAYGFDHAMWPVLEQYIPEGPGGTLSGPEGPSETTAPLRFPVDLFIAYGNRDTPVRVGVNLYYAGGAMRDWSIEDNDEDGFDDSSVIKQQTHLFNVTFGVAGGRHTDHIRPEGWLRAGVISAWSDRQSFRQDATGETPTVDRILSLDRDLRIGGGARVHIGDPSSLRGIVVSPAVRYDVAFGSFRFDDNLINPDSDAEEAIRRATGHNLQVGVGVAGRVDELRIIGTAAINATILDRFDQTNAGQGVVEQQTNQFVDVAIPEFSVGAEYNVLPALIVRAGVRSTVGAGRTINTTKNLEGDPTNLAELEVIQNIATRPVELGFEANGGIGLRVRRFALDATLGGLFLGQGTASFLSRIDMSFSFD